MEHKIVTKQIMPPIPSSRFDWVAYRDGREENGPFGFGRTIDEAVEELKEAEQE